MNYQSFRKFSKVEETRLTPSKYRHAVVWMLLSSVPAPLAYYDDLSCALAEGAYCAIDMIPHPLHSHCHAVASSSLSLLTC